MSEKMQDRSSLLLIRNARRYAPEYIGVGDILIGGGRILSLQSGIEPGHGVPCRVIAAEGQLAVPGFVDSLAHISGGGGEGGFASRTIALLPSQAFAAGVTTMMGALGTDDVTRSHADLLASARALNAHGLSVYALTGSYRVPVRTLTGSVRDDLVLIPDFIGVGELAIADHRGSQPSVEELARIASDARVGGLLAGKGGVVLVHVGDAADGLDSIDLASQRYPVPMRQWHPTHINRQRALLLQGIDWARRGGSVDLTTSTTPECIASGEVPAAQALAELLAAGVAIERISMSSDGQASLPHFDAHGTLLSMGVASLSSLSEAMFDAVRHHGVPFESALRAITASPAGIWGLKRKGVLSAGADADVVLLDPDTLMPLTTIARGRLQTPIL
ncbi:MAG: beta-aspartyl-peptidase [Pseudomonadota bacterium]|nr:beta-aspartyl-peptidase [Pseudomonadota bacterium]